MGGKFRLALGCICAAILLGGCATPYQKQSFLTGPGYTDEKLGDGVYWITSEVSAFTPEQEALNHWKRRANELCGTDAYDSTIQQSMRGSHGNFAYVEGIARCPGATAPVATIKDDIESEGDSKALIFYVDKINGKSVENSLQATTQASHGQGFHMTPQLIERPVLADGEVRLTLRAEVHFAAPILAIANMGKNYTASESIRFRPKPNGVYVVKGELTDARAAVWLEEDKTGEHVGTPEQRAGESAAK